jgi:replication-associated recombination protein RarA
MKFTPVTQKGYSLFEVASALQKTIRRGLEKEALYWGYELEVSNYGKYLWKRLVIIAIEDVGPATPDVLSQTLSFQKAYDDLKKKKSDGSDLAIAAAIVYLCRSKKSRLYDWAVCLMTETHEHHNLPIPD